MTRIYSAFFSFVLLSAAMAVSAESPHPFVPKDYEVPTSLETKNFRLRMLTVNDVVKDYDAVMSSFGGLSYTGAETGWPVGLTLEQNLIDLGWHQKEFQNRSSFAYTVVDLDESRVIGCVYINPTRKIGYDVAVSFWTRPPEQVSNIDIKILEQTVKKWLKEDWPFKSPGYPNVDISRAEWRGLEEVKR